MTGYYLLPVSVALWRTPVNHRFNSMADVSLFLPSLSPPLSGDASPFPPPWLFCLRREQFLKSNAQLTFRCRQLLSELSYIYPIDVVSA